MTRKIVLAGLLAALAVAACRPVTAAPAGPPTDATLPPPDTYVALGDSFVAGPLIPVQDLGPTAGCLRSSNNYPSLVAPVTGMPKFRDVSCSGARSDHMTEPQGVSPGPNPPQFDALGETTGIVTLGIGGNDIGFSDIAITCAEAFLQAQNCRDRYAPPGQPDQLRAEIDAAAPEVGAVLAEIRERAPRARVFVVNYLPIFPEGPDPVLGIEGCPPLMPISAADVAYLRGVQQYLNEMLAEQAAANGAVLVDAYAAGIGHDACRPPGVRWVEPAVFVPLAAPVHPNLQGILGVADALRAAINA
ncbi:MAG TPA: SGNH/GDSL hydrolase family protein [Acidimicrobiia bacterium]